MNQTNKIIIKEPIITSNRILYHYEVVGPWREAFQLEQEFVIDYDIDISRVPASVAIVPFLANVLPMAWVYDAEVVAPVCDSGFCGCLPEVKRGYEEMYPSIRFGGSVHVGRIEENEGDREGSICLFSGGVDAFNTLIQHIDERPMLFTLRGSDVSLDDDRGWHKVESHIETVAADFGVSATSASSSFRSFLDEGVLSKKVSESGDNWWHGFQHGLGIIGQVAPLVWALKKRTVYIASSFTAAEHGRVTCASDPTIDNFIRFCGACVVHDGYEFRRQDKVRNIIHFSRDRDIAVRLRVCWESAGGSNCCHCEKCLRTILALYAEGAEPCDFGFDCGDINKLGNLYHRKFSTLNTEEFLVLRYEPIQEAMRANFESSETVAPGFRWFYEGDILKLAHASSPRRFFAKFFRKIRSWLS